MSFLWGRHVELLLPQCSARKMDVPVYRSIVCSLIAFTATLFDFALIGVVEANAGLVVLRTNVPRLENGLRQYDWQPIRSENFDCKSRVVFFSFECVIETTDDHRINSPRAISLLPNTSFQFSLCRSGGESLWRSVACENSLPFVIIGSPNGANLLFLGSSVVASARLESNLQVRGQDRNIRGDSAAVSQSNFDGETSTLIEREGAGALDGCGDGWPSRIIQGIFRGVGGVSCGTSYRAKVSDGLLSFFELFGENILVLVKNPSLDTGGKGREEQQNNCEPFAKGAAAIVATMLLAIGAGLAGLGVYKSGDIGGWAALISWAGFLPFAAGLWLFARSIGLV